MTWGKDTVPHVDAYILDSYKIIQDVNAASAYLEPHDVQERVSVLGQIEGNGVESRSETSEYSNTFFHD